MDIERRATRNARNWLFLRYQKGYLWPLGLVRYSYGKYVYELRFICLQLRFP